MKEMDNAVMFRKHVVTDSGVNGFTVQC